MNHRVYPHCTYPNSSFFNVQKQIAKSGPKKSCVSTKCVPSNKQSSVLFAESDITNVQTSMCAKADVSREPHIVDEYKQEEHAKAYIRNWAKVIWALYDSGRERLAK